MKNDLKSVVQGSRPQNQTSNIKFNKEEDKEKKDDDDEE